MRIPDPAGSRVALIGTAAHGRADLPDLPAVAHNVVGLAETFADRRYAGLPGRNIRVLLDSSRPHTTGVEVMAAADEATDLLVVYLAGHILAGPADEPQFALARGGERSRSATLDLTWIARSLAASPASAKLLIVDALVAGPAAPGRDIADPLVELFATIDGATTWFFLTSDHSVYNKPGGAGTTFTAAMLEVVHHPHGIPAGLDLEYLHDATCGLLHRESLPLPRLWTRPGDVRSAAASSVALFSQTGLPPHAEDIDRLKALLADAGKAERNYHKPDLVVEAFRAAVVTAQRVLGPDHIETLRTRRQLAHWTGRAGDVTDAVHLFWRLYEDQQRVLGANHHDTLGVQDDIAYWSQRGKQ